MYSKMEFNFNAHKALEVILWLATKQPNIDFYVLLKTLFFAEKYHLAHYDKPIVGDVYIAMDCGQVAAATYDILKKDVLAVESLDELPFENVNKKIIPLRAPNLGQLSQSDIEALEFSINKYGHYVPGSQANQRPVWKKDREHGECVIIKISSGSNF